MGRTWEDAVARSLPRCPECGALGGRHRPTCPERVVVDVDLVEWDAAIVRLRELEADDHVGPAATTALYCVDEHRADPRTLLVVIERAADGYFDPQPGKMGRADDPPPPPEPARPMEPGFREKGTERPDRTGD